MIIEKFKKTYKTLFEWEYIIMSEEEMKEPKKSESVCACVSLQKMMQDVLWCKQELLNGSVWVNKTEMYDKLSSLEFEIKLLSNANNHIDREMFYE